MLLAIVGLGVVGILVLVAFMHGATSKATPPPSIYTLGERKVEKVDGAVELDFDLCTEYSAHLLRCPLCLPGYGRWCPIGSDLRKEMLQAFADRNAHVAPSGSPILDEGALTEGERALLDDVWGQP